MDNFQMLNKLIKEKLPDNHSKKTEIDPINPFYITREEIDTLLEDEDIEESKKEVLPGLDLIATLFQLNKKEKYTLLIIMALEISVKYERIYAYLENDLNKKYVTLSLLVSLLCEDDKEKREFITRLSSHSPLRFFHLISFIELKDGTALMHQPIGIEVSVRNFLLGHYSLDVRLEPYCRLSAGQTGPLDMKKIEEIKKIIQEGEKKEKQFVVHLYGHSDMKKLAFASETASAFGYGLLIVDTQLALSFFDSFNDLIVILYREAILSGSLLYFDKFDTFFELEQSVLNTSLLFSGLERFSWLTFFASQKEWKPTTLPKSHLFLTFAFITARYPESISLWERYLKEIDPILAAKVSPTLAQRFAFDEDEIEEVIHILKMYSFSRKKVDDKAVYRVCRQRVSTGLETLAQPIKSSNQLNDIVLPKEQKEQLSTVVSHYTNQFNVFEEWGFKKYFQSQGIGVLFTGASGTGKTMAASILANTLDLDLYRIELSQIVSKYIGETEKNLSKIFEAAEGSGVVLFFDEADALFGKRSETKDAHDRYANIEISYLLQKIEEYDGLVILASNFRQNIDEAFVRRMRFIINFPFPDQEMRKEIWEKVFPKDSPLEKDLDFSSLSEKFALSGANIRNISLFSAFFAIEQKDDIRMEHIIHGLKSELAKIGKNYKVSDFDILKNSK